MQRSPIGISILAALAMLAVDGFAQDNTPSSATPSAVGARNQSQPLPAPLQQDGPAVLKLCSSKFGPPCANVPPRVIRQAKATFSSAPHDKRIRGHVVLSLVVGADGLPYDIRVENSLGAEWDKDAIKAVRKYRFKSALMDGQPVPVVINVDVDFDIH
jgi:protein TonB